VAAAVAILRTDYMDTGISVQEGRGRDNLQEEGSRARFEVMVEVVRFLRQHEPATGRSLPSLGSWIGGTRCAFQLGLRQQMGLEGK
jgi:hypothetical protein